MKERLYVGTYTEDTASGGLYALDFDGSQGRLGIKATLGDVPNPSYLAHAGERMYVACEVDDRALLASYRLFGHGDAFGMELTSTKGIYGAAGTCFALVHPEGHCVYGANYASGSICTCALEGGDFAQGSKIVQHYGSGPNVDRQSIAHVHTLSFIPGTQVLVAIDLGCDAVVLYHVREDGSLEAPPLAIMRTPEGFGPRIVAYHPHLPIVALVGELACELMLYRYSEDGSKWTPCLDVPVALANPRQGRSLSAHVEFTRDGRFLYASTRGADILTMILLDGDGNVLGREDMPCAGNGPRHFSLSPDERFLAVANQSSGDITVFSRDLASGRLSHLVAVDIPQPSCVIWG